MRVLLFVVAAGSGCGGPSSTFPVVSEACIADAVTYNRTVSEEFRHPTKKPKTRPPVEVARELIEGSRTSGNTQIVPDDRTKTEMADRGVIETTASFKLCLGIDGVPMSVTRMSSSCFPRYDETIRTTIETWRYSPYSVDGVPAEVCTTINFDYQQGGRRRR